MLLRNLPPLLRRGFQRVWYRQLHREVASLGWIDGVLLVLGRISLGPFLEHLTVGDGTVSPWEAVQRRNLSSQEPILSVRRVYEDPLTTHFSHELK